MFIRYLWPAILWSVIILILTLIPGNAVPEVGIFQFDKLVHFFIFGMLMLLSSYGLKKVLDLKSKPVNYLMLTTLYSVSFGIMIEILQRFVPGRNFSYADIIANTIGVAIGYLAFIILKKRNTF